MTFLVAMIALAQAPAVCDPMDMPCRMLTAEIEIERLHDEIGQSLSREEWMNARIAAYEVEATLSAQDREKEGAEGWIDLAQSIVALLALGGAGKVGLDQYRSKHGA